ncbi:CLUMA_CG005937, isoform A, partial [Clunio marinus]
MLFNLDRIQNIKSLLIMDNLDFLSDDELRLRLIQYGFANLPITQTTRKTLIKKLRNHLSSANSNLQKTSSRITQYSSGEESDSLKEIYEEGKIRKTRMTTSGSPNNGKRLFSFEDRSMPPPSSSLSSQQKPFSSAFSIYNRSGTNYSPSNKKSSVYVSPVIINDSEDDEIDRNKKKSKSQNNSFKGAAARTTNRFSNQVNQSFSDSSFQNINGSNNSDQTSTDDIESTSEYTRRLLKYRGDNLAKQNSSIYKRSSFGSNRSYDKYPSSENSFHRTEFSSKQEKTPLRAALKSVMNRIDAACIPLVLVGFLVVFFLLIIFVYVTKSPDIENVIKPSTTSYALCADPYDFNSISCISEASLEPSLNLLKTLAHELQARVLAQPCSKAEATTLCVGEFWQKLNEKGIAQQYNEIDIIRHTHSIEYLIDINKQWGIQNVNSNGEGMQLEDVVKLRPDHNECFSILNPKLPITCTIYRKLQNFFLIIGCMAVVKLTGVFYEAVAYLEQNESRIYCGIETINGEDFKILRWIDDVNNISGLGVQISQGQQTQQQQQQRGNNLNFPQPDSRSYVTMKKWMGSAFDKSNKIKDPPTNCLKIRQMFNKSEINDPNLQLIIQDTILHKLKDKNCKIYDVQIDSKTCCVYVKCATCADAGIVHGEINGWWLDTGLVVVKFLRQDKYHQRFPDSINSNTILRPSPNIYITQNDSATNEHDDFFDEEIDDEDYE